jgi:uncharacterized protein (DUF885 family)
MENDMPPTTEGQFYKDAQAMLNELIQHNPIVATFLGDHRYDDRLGDLTPASQQAERERLGEWLELFESIDTEDWSLESQIDRTLTIQIIKQFIRDYDKMRTIFRYPGAAPDQCLNGVYLLIIREFAPLAQRMQSILGRLRETSRLLEEGRSILDPSDVPPLWAEIALESSRQGVGLFAAFVPMLAESTPELKEEVIQAAQAAAAALNEHAEWIEREVLPQAQGNFATGKEIFDEILREDHMVDYDADELLDTGWRLIEETEQQMNEVAAQIDPEKSVKELLEESKKNHPDAESLLDAYRQSMLAARQFVVEHELVSIPPGESIRIEPTPHFIRNIIPYAAYQAPGFLEDNQEGVFIVTPVEDQATPEQVEAKLRGHPLADIPVTALHEAYPGHHLQLVTANRSGSLPRKFGGFLSSLFIEGWAFYCEELMEQLGFIDQPIQKLARLQAQLWRAARIVLDVSLHTKEMSVEQAIDFLVERAGLEPDDAKAEVRRYTMSPTQPQSYLMGKLQILKIVEEYKQRYPQHSMLQMHDAILTSGSLPPRLMRQRLFRN